MEEILHVSRPTLDKLVKDLLRRGLIREFGERRERGGRPAVLFHLNERARVTVGADLELPGLYLVVADLAGAIHAEKELRLSEPLASPHEALRELAASLLSWLDELAIPRDLVGGVGVGMPIFFEGNAVTVKGKNLPTWIRVPAREILEGELGVPVTVGHDVHFMALAEAEKEGLTDRVLLYVAFRSGLRGDVRMGACLLIRGQLYRGAHGNGGTLHGAFVDPEEIEGRPRGEAAEAIAEKLAPHIVQAVALLDPDVVVLNTEELGELAGPVEGAVRERVVAALRGEPLGSVEVRRARVTDAPGALGAAMAVVRELFDHPEQLLAGEVVAGGKSPVSLMDSGRKP
jgi:predicted NBD/HSP70 family sugar kinase